MNFILYLKFSHVNDTDNCSILYLDKFQFIALLIYVLHILVNLTR